MNLDEKFIIIKSEENNHYYVYRKNKSLFEEEDYDLSLNFFEKYIKKEIENGRIIGFKDYLELNIKCSVVCSRFLYVRLSNKTLELKLEIKKGFNY